MENQERLMGWILSNSEKLNLKVIEFMWVAEWLPGWHDLNVEITIDGQLYTGRGTDKSRTLAILKGFSECVESLLVRTGESAAHGIAVHTDPQSAARKALLEYIERSTLNEIIDSRAKGRNFECDRSKFDMSAAFTSILDRLTEKNYIFRYLKVSTTDGLTTIILECVGNKINQSQPVTGLSCNSDIKCAAESATIEVLRNVACHELNSSQLELEKIDLHQTRLKEKLPNAGATLASLNVKNLKLPKLFTGSGLVAYAAASESNKFSERFRSIFMNKKLAAQSPELLSHLRRFNTSLIALYAATLVGLITAGYFVGQYHYSSLADSMARSIGRHIVIGDYREPMQMLSSFTKGPFASITLSGKNGEKIFSVPYDVITEQSSVGPLSSFFMSSHTSVILAPGTAETIANLNFTFSPFEFSSYVFIIWSILTFLSVPSVIRLRNRILDTHKAAVEKEKQNALRDMALTLAHDLRTPIRSLDLIIKTDGNVALKTVEKVQRVISRIQQIADGILATEKQTYETVRAELIEQPLDAFIKIIKNVVSEFNSSYTTNAGVKIYFLNKCGSGATTIRYNALGISRIVSNLIQNSIEAKREGQPLAVEVIASIEDNEAFISIKDNGCGIPEEKLKNLGQKGFTFNKPNGNGLGLFGSTEILKSWNGFLKINSALGEGTTVTINIPVYDRQKDILSKIITSRQIAVIDDDRYMLEVWTHFLQKNKFAGKFDFLNSSAEVDRYIKSQGVFNPLYLVDFHFEKNLDGVDLIKSRQLIGRSFLVTNAFDEADVLGKANAAGIPVLPKTCVA